MKLLRPLQSTFLASALLLSTSLVAKEVVFRTPSGELSIIDVAEDNTLSDVVGMINTAINTDVEKLYASEAFNDMESFGTEYVVDFMTTRQTKEPVAKGSGRNYAISLQPHEKNEISHVIETLGNSSLVSIAKAKSSLEKAGREVDHVHPLQFLGFIFSTEKLKAAMHNMRDRSWVWGRFFKGVKAGLDIESNNHNILPFIKDFSSRVGIDPKIIYPLAEQRRWKEFVDALLAGVPRSSNSSRYDM